MTMNGLRTRKRSETTPIRITAKTLKPQFQLPSPLACLVVKPKIVWA